MPLPPLEATTPPHLPYREQPWGATLNEVRERFVDQAPTDQQPKRAFLWQLLEAHATLVEKLFKGHRVRMWIDGGFLTHKDWKAPRDIDVVYLVPIGEINRATTPKGIPLWTQSNVKSELGSGGKTLTADSVKPGFGLIDAYISPDNDSLTNIWKARWSSVKDANGNIIDGQQKGFVEVILNG